MTKDSKNFQSCYYFVSYSIGIIRYNIELHPFIFSKLAFSLVVDQLSVDLYRKFPKDKGYSVRNLYHMRRFAEAYPDFPILQVPLAEFQDKPILPSALKELTIEDKTVNIPLTVISWFHHISLKSKIEYKSERAFYILKV